ncbi:hypothetical protein M1523_02085 [Patescibacteria group bacterium]|nr:hypothetical protein [Patescibacteria group bacterium]MCL5092001.1 hypothetical protein [Patescibacteria group bacterium]
MPEVTSNQQGVMEAAQRAQAEAFRLGTGGLEIERVQQNGARYVLETRLSQHAATIKQTPVDQRDPHKVELYKGLKQALTADIGPGRNDQRPISPGERQSISAVVQSLGTNLIISTLEPEQHEALSNLIELRNKYSTGEELNVDENETVRESLRVLLGKRNVDGNFVYEAPSSNEQSKQSGKPESVFLGNDAIKKLPKEQQELLSKPTTELTPTQRMEKTKLLIRLSKDRLAAKRHIAERLDSINSSRRDIVKMLVTFRDQLKDVEATIQANHLTPAERDLVHDLLNYSASEISGIFNAEAMASAEQSLDKFSRALEENFDPDFLDYAEKLQALNVAQAKLMAKRSPARARIFRRVFGLVHQVDAKARMGYVNRDANRSRSDVDRIVDDQKDQFSVLRYSKGLLGRGFKNLHFEDIDAILKAGGGFQVRAPDETTELRQRIYKDIIDISIYGVDLSNEPSVSAPAFAANETQTPRPAEAQSTVSTPTNRPEAPLLSGEVKLTYANVADLVNNIVGAKMLRDIRESRDVTYESVEGDMNDTLGGLFVTLRDKLGMSEVDANLVLNDIRRRNEQAATRIKTTLPTGPEGSMHLSGTAPTSTAPETIIRTAQKVFDSAKPGNVNQEALDREPLPQPVKDRIKTGLETSGVGFLLLLFSAYKKKATPPTA